jgi:hypothetical protein
VFRVDPGLGFPAPSGTHRARGRPSIFFGGGLFNWSIPSSFEEIDHEDDDHEHDGAGEHDWRSPMSGTNS